MWAVGRISLLSWGRPQAPAAEVAAVTGAAVPVPHAEPPRPVSAPLPAPEVIEVREPRALPTAALRMQDEPATLVISVPDDVSEPSDGEASRLAEETPAEFDRASAVEAPASVAAIEPAAVAEPADRAAFVAEDVAGVAAEDRVVETSPVGVEGNATAAIGEVEASAVRDEPEAAPPSTIEDVTAAHATLDSAFMPAGEFEAAGLETPDSVVEETAPTDDVAGPERESLVAEPPPAPGDVGAPTPVVDGPLAEPVSAVDATVEAAPGPLKETPDIEISTVAEPEPVPTPIAPPEPAVPVVMALETVPAPTPEIRATPSTLRVDAKTVVTPAKPVEAAPPRMGFLQRLFLRILNFFRAILGL